MPHRGASEVANEAASKVAGHGKRLPPVGCMATTKQAAWNLGGLQDQVWFHDLGAPICFAMHQWRWRAFPTEFYAINY